MTGSLLRAAGVARKRCSSATRSSARTRRALGSSRGGIDYEYVGEVDRTGEVEAVLAPVTLDELIVADAGLDEERLLQIVEAAHRRGVKVRVAPRTRELLVERGEYVPGQGVPLFELRPPIFAGAEWLTKRAFDLVVSVLVVILGLPVWLLIALVIKLTSRGPVFYADRRVGLGEREFRCSSSGRWSPAPKSSRTRSRRRTRRRRAVQDPPRPARDAVRACAAATVARRVPERPQRAAGRDVPRRPAAAAFARLRAAGAVAPPALQRVARA